MPQPVTLLQKRRVQGVIRDALKFNLCNHHSVPSIYVSCVPMWLINSFAK